MKLAKALELRAILKRSARAALPIILLFILGVSLRIALYFPLAAFQLDSDAVIAGLCGFRVLDGSHPVFLPGGIRIGAASCYVAAAYFSLLGHGRIGLALTGLTWNLLYLASSFLFLKSAVSPRLLLPAFLFVVFPTEQFMTVSYAPWGYGEIMCVCAGTLWLAAEWRKKPQIITLLALGLAIGLGVWFSLQTIMITVPALAWVALQRRTAFFREALIAIPGVFVGALPFIMANVGHGFPTLTQNFYSQTVSNAAQAISNFVWFGTNLLPKLLFRFPASPDWIIMSVAFVLVAIGAAVALRKPANGKEGGLIDLLPLLVLTLVACTAIFSLSAAGIIRGWTVRYIAPLYLVIPIFYAIGLTRLWRWSKVGTATIAAALIIPNILTYGLPGSAQRSALTAELQADVRLRDQLSAHHVRLLYGDYLWVYHFNFDSREQIAGVPSQRRYDYYKYGDRLGAAPVRWALLGTLQDVTIWSRAVRVPGTILKSGNLWTFIAERRTQNAAQLLSTLDESRLNE